MANDYYKTDPAGHKYAGDHALMDLYGAVGLDNADFLKHIIERAAVLAGATVILSNYHVFSEGGGISGMTLLAESHISIHTWPERQFAAVDLFMCGNADPMIAAEHIGYCLGAKGREVRLLQRGMTADPN